MFVLTLVFSAASVKTNMTSRTKQLEIPGAERPVIEELEEQALKYREARNERMALTKDETAEREKLRDLMVKHDLEVYRFVADVDGEEKRLRIKRTVTKEKVSVVADVGDDEDDEVEVEGES